MKARPAASRGAALSAGIAAAIGAAFALVAPPAPAQDAGAGRTWTSCVEHLPEGATRPDLTEVFPERGLSGYASDLVVTVRHGKGETVLPEGFRVQTASDAARGLAQAGFALPDQDGGSPARVAREETDASAVTTLTIPFVPLPKEAGRNELTLPPVPIAVQRAGGEIVTVCTRPHAIRVEDPTANEADPKVKPNPPPRPQREDWALARQVSIGVAIGAVLTVLALWLYSWWRKRPKKVVLPPARLPWVVALEELDAIRVSRLLAEGKGDVYFDRVSGCVRKYLGARYGFDGLETTTDEMRGFLKRVRPAIPRLAAITDFLEDCDLVKFARVVPAEEDCLAALSRGETIVHMTVPPVAPPEPRAKEAA